MKIFILLITTLATQTVWAGADFCHRHGMNGVWTSYQGAVAGNPHTGICTFTVSGNAAQGSCDFSTGFKGPFQGSVNVNKDCSATLTMDFAPVPVVSSFQVQLHKDRQSFTGRWQNNFGVIGVTNAIKR